MRRAYSYIRFSTPDQSKGNSKERQIKASRAYADEHKLLLDETLNLSDLGVSAFKGANLRTGALGNFIKAVEQGIVKPGSYLLVESLDRLSRQEVTKQLKLFLDLIERGITIVTLTDKMVYSNDSINENSQHLLASLLVMCRAYEESSIKGKRIRSAWQSKREKAGKGSILTATCPAWLCVNAQRTGFMALPDRCALVSRIFRMAECGMGQTTIAKTLNAERVPVWADGKGWHDSYIQKILTNRAVVGEFQPHEIQDGKRQPVGDPIPNYFPKVIQAARFHSVANRRRQNALFLGKAGKGVRNLFTGIAKCGYTGTPMICVNKGNQTYLVSDSARRGLGGQYVSWSYRQFETAFLTYFSDLDFSTIAGVQRCEVEAIENALEQCRDSRRQAKASLDRLITLAETSDTPPATILTRIAELEKELRGLDEKVERLDEKLKTEMSGAAALADQTSLLKEVMEKRDNEEFRFLLRSLIRSTVSRIDVFAAGFQWTKGFWDSVFGNPASDEERSAMADSIVKRQAKGEMQCDPEFLASLRKPRQVQPWDEVLMANQKIEKEERYFTIVLKTGEQKSIQPRFSNAKSVRELDLEQMVWARSIGDYSMLRWVENAE